MNNLSMRDFIESELSWALDDSDFELESDVVIRGIAGDLADSLKSNGYCSDPYFEYDKALMCQINKRHEPHCCCTHCTSYEFCIKLRKEGYV